MCVCVEIARMYVSVCMYVCVCMGVCVYLNNGNDL